MLTVTDERFTYSSNVFLYFAHNVSQIARECTLFQYRCMKRESLQGRALPSLPGFLKIPSIVPVPGIVPWGTMQSPPALYSSTPLTQVLLNMKFTCVGLFCSVFLATQWWGKEATLTCSIKRKIHQPVETTFISIGNNPSKINLTRNFSSSTPFFPSGD